MCHDRGQFRVQWSSKPVSQVGAWKKVCKMKICVQEGYWRYAFKYITCAREKAVELGRMKK